MRSFVFIVVLAVAVNARPEPPSGYNYRAPAPPPVNNGYQNFNHQQTHQVNHGVSNFVHQQTHHQQQPQTIVQKHIYVHVPPPEEEAQVFHAQQALAQPRKHYKIIFIKAPSAPSLTQQIAAAQAHNEEKTLIYVLVKKPEDVSIPEQPAQIQLPVSKPEVYFIKYKTQKDSVSSGVNAGGHQVHQGYDVPPPNPQATYGAPIKK